MLSLNRQICHSLAATGVLLRALSQAAKPTIDGFFTAKSYAIVGASTKVGSLGYSIAKNFKETFKGKVYLVNPKGGELLGMKMYKRVEDLPDGIEAACIANAAELATKAVEDCVTKKGIKNFVVIAGGFAESDEKGKKLQERMVDVCMKNGARLIGPNGMGVLDTISGTNTLFISKELLHVPPTGPVSLISQSGALGCSWFNTMGQYDEKKWISKFISFGNASDVNENDALEYFGRDENTKQIWSYLEGLRDAPNFFRSLRQVTKTKPALIIKANTGAAGAQASGSHSASLAANDAVADYLLKQAGAIRIHTWTDLFDMGLALRYQPLPQGRRIGLLTNAGGMGVMSADAMDKYGMSLPHFEEKTHEDFKKRFPPYYVCANPMDLTGSASTQEYIDACKLAIADKNTDLVMCCLQPSGPNLAKPEEFCKIIGNTFGVGEDGVDHRPSKPIFFTIFGSMPGTEDIYYKNFLKYKLPIFKTPETCVKVVNALATYNEHLKAESEKVRAGYNIVTAPKTSKPNPKIQAIIDNARRDGRKLLLEPEGREVFKLSGLQVPEAACLTSPDDAVKLYEKIRNPCVMKICSPQVIHKTDEGGVFLNVNSPEQVYKTYKHLADKFAKRDFRGVYMYEMVKKGTEMVVGMNTDPVFGPLVLTGFGGELVEILKDVSFGMAPVDKFDALDMISKLRNQKMLNGYRGSPAVNRNALADAIVKISQLVDAHRADIKEIDANPLIAHAHGDLIAVDARVLLH